MRVLIITINLILLTWHFSYSQNYNLEDCIDIAIDNSFDVQRSELSYDASAIDVTQAKNNFYPTANFSYNFGSSAGRSIDPYTNSYINRQLSFSNVSSDANMMIFNGGRLRNQLRMTEKALSAAKSEIDEQKERLTLDVIVAYTQVLNDEAIIELSVQRTQATLERLNRLRILNKQEAGDPALLADMEAQYLNDSLNIINAKNTFRNSKLVLCQLMNISYSDNFTFNSFNNSDLSPQLYDPQDVYKQTLNQLSAFPARKLRVQEAELAIQVAQSAIKPSVFLFGGLSSNYSSAASILVENGTNIQQTDYFINGENGDIPVMERSTSFLPQSISYPDQIFNNISSNAGIAIRIPIYSQKTLRNNISRAKVDLDITNLDLKQTEIQYLQAIQQICMDINNVIDRINILELQLKAFEESYRINQVKLDNGVSNNVEYIISKNNLENAKLQLTSAKFEYRLLEKVVEFYTDN